MEVRGHGLYAVAPDGFEYQPQEHDSGRVPFPVAYPGFDAPDGAILELTDSGKPGWWQRQYDEDRWSHDIDTAYWWIPIADVAPDDVLHPEETPS